MSLKLEMLILYSVIDRIVSFWAAVFIAIVDSGVAH